MTKQYRILYVEPASHLGGSVTSLLRLLSKLNRQLYEPIVLLNQPSELVARFQAAGVSVLWLNEQPIDRVAASENQVVKRDIAVRLERYSRRWANAYRSGKVWLAYGQRHFREAWRLARLMRAQQIDLVHLNNRLSDARSAALAAVLTNTPIVCHVRYYDPLHVPDRWLAQRIHRFIFMSRSVADDTRARLPNAQGAVLYDGITLPPELTGEQRRRVRERWGVGETDFVVGNVGRIVGWKGQDVFLRAVARLAPSHPHLQAVIVGDTDPPEDAVFYRQLQALVSELGLGGRVTFAGQYDNMPELMGALDVLAHTATSPEPFGLVVLEAMAAGRPVVASAAGGVLDMVTDKVTGLLSPLKDDQALAEALARLADDPSLRHQLGEAGRARVAAHFTLEQFAAGVESVYEAVLIESGFKGVSRSPLMSGQALSNQR